MIAPSKAKMVVAFAGLAMAAGSAMGQAITPPNTFVAGAQWAYFSPYEQQVTATGDVQRFRLVVNAAEALGGSWQSDMMMELRSPMGTTLLVGGDFGTPYPGSLRWDDPTLMPIGEIPLDITGPQMIDAIFTYPMGEASGLWQVNFYNNYGSGGEISWNDIQIIPCTPGVCPDIGGCCLPNGTCQFVLESECSTLGGTFAGANVDCITANCPTPPGVVVEIGDAGDMPATAQIVDSGSGTVTAIRGNVPDPMDVDMYKIEICDPAAFMASTFGNGTDWDTTVFLFNDQGLGVVMNDDSNSTVQSTLTPAFIPFAGEYYLAITRYNRHPVSASGRIWEATPFNVERAPDGPGAFDAISGWDGSVASTTGDYIIDLQGVCYIGGGACYANCDGSTVEPVLNVDDFTCFINEFAAAQSLPYEQQVTTYSNCDGSTVAPVLNVDDFTCFINEFAAGCP